MSDKPKLTQWFPPSVKPARPGVYELGGTYRGEWAYFDGLRWGWASHSRSAAAAQFHTHGASQNKPWRGLAERPGASKEDA